jgi:hypothetical protein
MFDYFILLGHPCSNGMRFGVALTMDTNTTTCVEKKSVKSIMNIIWIGGLWWHVPSFNEHENLHFGKK